MTTATVILVAAMAENGVIGRDGQLPWRLPDDMKRFRRLTMGNAVLMGRKTWDSLGKPLDGRENRVLTRDRKFSAAGALAFHDLREAMAAPTDRALMVIGGAELYRQAMPLAGRMELTMVHATVAGDTRFPNYVDDEWIEVARESHGPDDRHPFAFSFVTLERRAGTL